ncbi:MAG: hypothetical protein J0I06_28155 [Planctomycetes bacterium]|nr:hypothetical protein [Planctomycetota bacterium]
MNRIRRLASGNLIVPMRAESNDGKIIGDALVEIGPDHPQFAVWEEWLRKNPKAVVVDVEPTTNRPTA